MGTVAEDENIRIDRLELGSFMTNAYIMTCRKTGESVVVDAPGESRKLVAALGDTKPQHILMTHSHIDHVGGLADLKKALNVPVAAHADDADNMPVPADVLLKDGDTITFGSQRLEVLHTPGHTPGGLCFYTGKYLISGDTLFPGGPGRTWAPEGFRQIIESISQKIFKLPEDTVFYPGHGGSGILGKEMRAFEAFMARQRDPKLFGEVIWEG